ncbi:hypothetical protein [Desulfocicer vacuolatum]|nr:hypothetical protein [Desulfocicer vacuolatum]
MVRNKAGQITGTEYHVYESPALTKGVDKSDTPSMEDKAPEQPQ